MPFYPPSRAAWVRHPLAFAGLAVVLVLGWSSGFVGIRLATEHASPILVLLWRNLVAGLLLLPFALLIGPRISFRALGQQMAFGFVGMFLYLASFALAIGWRVPTGLVALISDLVPLAIAVLSQPLLGQALGARQWLGTAIGVLGVVIVSADSLSLGAAPLFAYALPVAGMLLFAGMTVMQKKLHAIHMPIHQSLAIQCLTAAGLFALWRLGDGGLMPPMEASFVLGIAWLVIAATFICYAVYYYLLRHHPPARVSAVVFLSPPVTMLWAFAMFGEPLTLTMGLGLGVTLAGVYLAALKA
ncbi:MAG: DMT family transporter [Alphaproteobacteria bacterium]|nr:DMT family transporter [Alphaproteobacteria bacterium]